MIKQIPIIDARLGPVTERLLMFAIFGLCLGTPRTAEAEWLIGLVEANRLMAFDSTTPSITGPLINVTGLSNDTLVGIDYRPATGELYGLSAGPAGAGRLYVINPVTGVATLKATLAADPTDTTSPFSALAGTDFGIDFNPVVDQLRVVSDADENLRINADTGFVITDTPLAFAAGDTNAGANATVVEIAYSNNVPGATDTTLFGADSGLHKLVRQGGPDATPSPNLGQLTTLMQFGGEGMTPKGFDVSSGGKAFAACELSFEMPTFVLVGVDLAGLNEESLGHIGNGQIPIKDMTVAPSLQLSADLYAVNESAGNATITVTRSPGSVGTATVAYSTSNMTASAGADYGSTSGTLTFGPGEMVKTFTVPIMNDAESEEDEFVLITLSNPAGPSVLGFPSAAMLRINASDRYDVRGPVALRLGLTGPSRRISGAVLHFNEDLEPGRADALSNYVMTARGTNVERQIELSSASYNPVLRTVTLTARETFGQTQFEFVEIVIKGGPGGIADLSGNPLDAGGGVPRSLQLKAGLTNPTNLKLNWTGGHGPFLVQHKSSLSDPNWGTVSSVTNRQATVAPSGNAGFFRILDTDAPRTNAIFLFRVVSGETLDLEDEDGDRATITIEFGGRLDAIVPVDAPATQQVQFWLLEPIALRSVLSGRLRQFGDGIIVISEIIGLDKSLCTPLVSNPSFRVNTLTFSSNATGR